MDIVPWGLLKWCWDFLGGSDGKASIYNAGDLGSIPGLGRSAGERNGKIRVHFIFIYTLVIETCQQISGMSFKVVFISLVAQMVKCLPIMQETWVRSLGREDPLEKEMATHSSTLAWKIPWTEEPGRLQSMGSQGVGHD